MKLAKMPPPHPPFPPPPSISNGDNNETSKNAPTPPPPPPKVYPWAVRYVFLTKNMQQVYPDTDLNRKRQPNCVCATVLQKFTL